MLGGVGVLGLVWGLVRGGASGWGSPEVVASILAGVAGLAAFVAWELRAPAPMLPMRFFRLRAFAAANVASLLAYFGLLGGVFLITQFLQTGMGYSPVEAGLRTLPWTLDDDDRRAAGGRALGSAGAAAAHGRRAGRGGPGVRVARVRRRPGCVLRPARARAVLLGAGSAAFFAPVAAAQLSAVRPAEHGQASGASLTIREFAGVLGVAVLAAVFAANGGYESRSAFVDGLVPALWIACAAVAAAALAALAVPRRPALAGRLPRRLVPEPA